MPGAGTDTRIPLDSITGSLAIEGPNPWADVVNLKFAGGAKGTGGTVNPNDDSAAFQAATDYVFSRGGGFVFFGPFNFRLNSNVTPRPGVSYLTFGGTLSGVGAASVVPLVNFGVAAGTLIGPISVVGGALSGALLDWGGAVFNVNSALNPSGAGILAGLAPAIGAGQGYLPAGTFAQAAGIVMPQSGGFSGASRAGSIIRQGDGLNILQLLSGSFGPPGTHMTLANLTYDANGAANPNTQNTILFNQNLGSAFNLRVIGSPANGGAGRAVSFEASNDGSLIASHIENAGNWAVYINTANRTRIALNRIDNSGADSIHFQPGAPGKLTVLLGNIINNPVGIGIALSPTLFVSTVGNVVNIDVATVNHCIDHGAVADAATVGNVLSGGNENTSWDGATRVAYVGNVGRAATGASLGIFNGISGRAAGRDAVFAANVFSNAGQSAVNLDGVNHIAVLGNVLKNAGLTGPSIFDAISVTQFNPFKLSRILLALNIGYDDQTVKTQKWGLNVSVATVGDVTAFHNDFRGNLLGAVQDLGPDTYLHGNLGFNPRGILAPPAIPASGVLFQNPFNVDCTLYIKGGTLTDISVGGLPAPATWAAQPTLSTATVGGTLVPGTYAYRVAALNALGHTIECVEVSIVVPAGTNTNTVTVNLPINGLRGVVGWNIFGRAAGAELGMVTNWQWSDFIDTGAIVPAGAMPGTDTTGNASTGISAAAPAGAVHTVRLHYAQCLKLTYTVVPTGIVWQGD